LLRRLVTLISAQAALGASSQAFRKQAEGASQAARQYLEDNDALRKVPPALKTTLKIQNILKKNPLKNIEGLLRERAESEVQAMRRQAQGLTREYDRLLEQHARLQVRGHPKNTPGS
ncbi:BAP31 protein, partial [Dryoscopus gambensis]|nr:BAP31 protein [Dryoscopus gambensis]